MGTRISEKPSIELRLHIMDHWIKFFLFFVQIRSLRVKEYVPAEFNGHEYIPWIDVDFRCLYQINHALRLFMERRGLLICLDYIRATRRLYEL